MQTQSLNHSTISPSKMAMATRTWKSTQEFDYMPKNVVMFQVLSQGLIFALKILASHPKPDQCHQMRCIDKRSKEKTTQRNFATWQLHNENVLKIHGIEDLGVCYDAVHVCLFFIYFILYHFILKF